MGFWHSKEGRYRLFTDQERREFGERRREEMSKVWHAKFVSKWTLLHERGWTQEAIDEFLGLPVKSGVPTDAFYRYRVERAENSKRFKAFMEKLKAEKEDWDINWVSKSLLKEAGWTESAMRKLLPEPVRKGRFVKYRREDVRKAEESEEFKSKGILNGIQREKRTGRQKSLGTSPQGPASGCGR
jgi:hypothetical protein